MTDPLRSDRPANAADVPERDREARVEELLLAGLDHYFAEQYDLAINVWTRVLFIDRGHARARAYIERARGAIAERQRRGDELLHTGTAAFDRGDAGAARELVTSAVEHGASADQALALLARIERLEQVTHGEHPVRRRGSAAPHAGVPPVAASAPPWHGIAAAVAAGVILGAIGIGALVARGITPWPLADVVSQTSPPFETTLPVPTPAEVAVSRAETFVSRGRLHDALRALEAVPDGDPLRGRADALKADVQRRLLEAARSARPQPVTPPGRRP